MAVTILDHESVITATVGYREITVSGEGDLDGVYHYPFAPPCTGIYLFDNKDRYVETSKAIRILRMAYEKLERRD